MSTPVDRIFVYGTLRVGMEAHSLIAERVVTSAPATIRGRLIALPPVSTEPLVVLPVGYPGLVEGHDSTVVGEVLTVARIATVLPMLDDFEGDQYERVLRHVTLQNGAQMTAWCYVFTENPLQRRIIESGDWREYVRSRSQ
ncbi:MAG: gamma-glutamylcyclotransferase [Proteobacteria bacterium]|nr:gamma-glutamylcyclotransferase [Pseudomonadota bacterium]